jgi:GNAT superfamily N-acetyltransferase
VDDLSLDPVTSAEEIERLWSDFNGLPIVTINRTYESAQGAEALVCRDAHGRLVGHVSWSVDSETAEIITVEAVEQGRHLGGRLLDAAEARIRDACPRRIIVTTTNDNLRAQAFYMRRGYHLVRIELNGMDRVRALKPGVPLTGHEGLRLRDMWEFEKEID